MGFHMLQYAIILYVVQVQDFIDPKSKYSTHTNCKVKL